MTYEKAEEVDARMRRLAHDHGQPEVIEWVEACIERNKAWFKEITGTGKDGDLERADQRKLAARQALTPEQVKLSFLKE